MDGEGVGDLETRLLKVREEPNLVKRLIEYDKIREDIGSDRRLLWEAVCKDTEAVNAIGGLDQLCHEPGWEQIRQEYTDTSGQKKDSLRLAIGQNWGEKVVTFFQPSNNLPLSLQILPLSYQPLRCLETLSQLEDVGKSVARINMALVNRLRESISGSRKGLQCNKPTLADISKALERQSHDKIALVEHTELQQLKQAGMPLEFDPTTGVLAAPWIVAAQHKNLPAWSRFIPEAEEASNSATVVLVEPGLDRSHTSSDSDIADTLALPNQSVRGDELCNNVNEGSTMRFTPQASNHTHQYRTQ
jgi:hypothetical protein